MSASEWARRLRWVPKLTVRCPWDNYHWHWESICTCGHGYAEPDEGWYGGLFDLHAEVELVPSPHAHPETARLYGCWALEEEEETLLTNWRAFQEDVIQPMSSSQPYNYRVVVELPDDDIELIRTVYGLPRIRVEAGPIVRSERKPS